MDKGEANALLFKAADSGSVDDARAALDAGADANVKINATPLHHAAANGHAEIVALLISFGANVDSRDSFDVTPLHYAAINGHAAIAERLVENGADLNANRLIVEHGVPSMKTPAQMAEVQGHTNVVRIWREATAKHQQGHTGRVTKDRSNKGPPQVGG